MPADVETSAKPVADAQDLTSVSDDELMVAPDWRVKLGRGALRGQRYSMSEADQLKAGLSREEAAFEGRWHFFLQGINIDSDRTFRYWSTLPESETVSTGTWSVQGLKLILEHREVRGRRLDKPILTEHTIEDFTN